MADSENAAPAATTAPSTPPPTPVETKPEDAKPYTPLSQLDPAMLAAEFEREGLLPPKEAPPAAEAPKADSAKTDAAKAPPTQAKAEDDGLPTLLKLAKDRDAQRKQAEQKELDAAKPYMDALKVLSPVEAQALARAKQMGDPISALTALGFTHAQYTARLLGQNTPQQEKTESPKTQPQSEEVLTLKQRLENLERERQDEKMTSMRSQAMSAIQGLLKDDPKFRTIAGLEDYEGVERTLIQYHRENGSLPGATFEESVKLAAELYEYDLKKQAERWRKVLTPAQQAAQTPAVKAPEPPSAGTERSRTLTNASASSPAPVRASPKSRQELIQAYIERGDDALV